MNFRPKEPLQSNSIKVADLHCELTQPEGESSGVIIFLQETAQGPTAHNSALAKILNKNKLSTHLPSSRDAHPERTDIFSLADQIRYTAHLICEKAHISASSLGYFGTGAGAEAVLIAAAQEPDLIGAVVARGSHPNNFSSLLSDIKAPVLLIAPGRDHACVRSNQAALMNLNKQSAMNVISTASAAFQEPGVLEESAQLASLWFLQHLG